MTPKASWLRRGGTYERLGFYTTQYTTEVEDYTIIRRERESGVLRFIEGHKDFLREYKCHVVSSYSSDSIMAASRPRRTVFSLQNSVFFRFLTTLNKRLYTTEYTTDGY